MGDVDVKEILKEFLNNKENWRFGLYCGIFLTVLIIYLISSSNVSLPMAWTSSSYDIGVGEKQFYIHQGNDIIASLDVLNVSGQCMDLQMNYKNGQYYKGNFCEGQTFNLGEWSVKIDKILVGTSLKTPIKVTAYQMVSLGGLFQVLLIIIPLISIWDKVNQNNQRKRDEAYDHKKKQFAKKFKIKDRDLDDFIKFISESMEE